MTLLRPSLSARLMFSLGAVEHAHSLTGSGTPLNLLVIAVKAVMATALAGSTISPLRSPIFKIDKP